MSSHFSAKRLSSINYLFIVASAYKPLIISVALKIMYAHYSAYVEINFEKMEYLERI